MHFYGKIVLSNNEKWNHIIQWKQIEEIIGKAHIMLETKSYIYNDHENNNAVTLGFTMVFFCMLFLDFSGDTGTFDCLFNEGVSIPFATISVDWISLPWDIVLVSGVLFGMDTISIADLTDTFSDELTLLSYGDTIKNVQW